MPEVTQRQQKQDRRAIKDFHTLQGLQMPKLMKMLEKGRITPLAVQGRSGFRKWINMGIVQDREWAEGLLRNTGKREQANE